LGKLDFSKWVAVGFRMPPEMNDTAAISSAPSIGSQVGFQRRATIDNVQQNVDVGVRTRAVFGILRVLGENGKSVRCCSSIDGTEILVKILINGERTLLAGLIFDRSNDGSVRVNKVDTGKAIDGWQKLQVFLKRSIWLDHHGIL
jgi:hypothetical protein